MKSLQVEAVYSKQSDRDRFSDLRVLKSAAGWYIGTIHTLAEGFQEPGSRDTDYFPTKEIAEEVLAHLNSRDQDYILDYHFDRWLQEKGYDPRGVGYRITP